MRGHSTIIRRFARPAALASACLVALSGAAAAQQATTLSEGWNTITTDAKCSTGTPYRFYVRPGASENLLIFFNGGGACWSGRQCNLTTQPTTHYPFAEMDENNPANFGGIFNFDSAENPVADLTMVVLPYCTGDVHVGSGPRTYEMTGADGTRQTVEVFHNGFENASGVLNWVYENYPEPARIVVSGASAGAIGSSFHSGRIAEHYPDVPVTLIADAAGGYNSPNIALTMNAWDVASVLPDWPEYAGETNDTLTFEDFYIASANHAPNLTIAQINSANDLTQMQFTLLLGDAPGSFTIPQRILNNYVEIESAVDALSTFTNGGEQHVVVLGPEFYQYSVQNMRLRDWFAGLAAGEQVPDLSCVDEVRGCAQAPQ